MDTVTIADGIPQNPKYVVDFDFWVIWEDVCFSEERFKQLVEKFKADYNGIQPQFICRAPGRVNLIGNIN